MNQYLKAAIPHIIAIVVFFVLAQVYYLPETQGKVLNQSDNVQARGMATEAYKYEQETGKTPLWTNSMFGGMPTYQIRSSVKNNLVKGFTKIFMLGKKSMSPSGALILLMLMFYGLMLVLGVDWRLGILGAIAYGFTVNHIVLTEAGHTTKVLAMGYMPAILASIILTFRGRYLLGGALTALFIALELIVNHIQITYYFAILIVIFGIIELIKAYKAGELVCFGKAAGVLLLAAAIGGGVTAGKLLGTYEYQQETIRGKSELTKQGSYAQSYSDKEKGEGLSKGYIFGWSYGVSETMSLLVPDFRGGATSFNFYAEDGTRTNAVWQSTLPKIQQQSPNNFQSVAQNLVQKASHYWGAKPSTSGPVYAGAIVCFLFVLGLILVKTPFKWWIVIASLLAFMFGWGENFKAFNYFMVDHFPLFNKFRAVDMAMGIPQMMFVALAMLGLKELMTNKALEKSEKLKALYMAGGITAGLCLLIWIGSYLGFYTFTREQDFSDLGGGLTVANFPEFWSAVKADRAGILRADALRSFAFIAAGFGVLWLYLRGTLKWTIVIPILGVLMLWDAWAVDRRYLDNEDFKPKSEVVEIQPRPVDQQIMADTDPHFRVLDLSRFNENQPPYTSTVASYFHKSLGGYHAAKLGLFQDLCEHYLFGYNPTGNAHITGMLNVKYFILSNPQGGQPYQIQNNKAYGNAWFIDTIKYVPDANAEMEALATLDPSRETVVQEKHKTYLDGLNLSRQAGEHITLSSYHPDKMEYTVKANSEKLAMFSEMYYPPSKGWSIYIDKGNGKERLEGDFIKANYAIRAARIPAGDYKLIMEFQPKKFIAGQKLTLITSLLILIGLIAGIYFSIKGKEIEPTTTEFINEESAAPKRKERKPKATKKTITKKETGKKRRKK